MKTLFCLLAALILSPAQASTARDSGEATQTLTVIALVKVKPGAENAFKEAASKILAPTRREAGNIQYEFNQSMEDPTEFSTVEKWRSAADLDQHMKASHMQTFFAEVGNYFEPGFPQIKKFQKFEAPLSPQNIWSCDVTGGNGSAEAVDIVLKNGKLYGSVTYSQFPGDEAVYQAKVTESRNEDGTIAFTSKNGTSFVMTIHAPSRPMSIGQSAKAEVRGYLPASGDEGAESYDLDLECTFKGTDGLHL